jgi:hypothetical protein
MAIQNSLLLEQIDLLKDCTLGKKLFGSEPPRSVEEFRSRVPLTSYPDYCPAFLHRQEDILPRQPARWIKSSGKSGEYPYKWIPVSQRFWEEASLNFCAIAILSGCNHRDHIPIKPGFRLLHAAAPAPFLTDAVARNLRDTLGFQFIPPFDVVEQMPFQERLQKGFDMAMNDGMDGFYGLAGVLVAIGEKFKQSSGKLKYFHLLKQPKALLRLLRGWVTSKKAGRPLMPKDLWSLKVITSMGTDSVIYKRKIEELWGRTPLNVYGNTETTIVATQAWNHDGMFFFPNLNFLEFLPEDEIEKCNTDKTYLPHTVLLNQVHPNIRYELVITNFHGGGLVRYRVGDLIRITSLSNSKLGIQLPAMELEGRADDLVDLGFVRLTERTLWQAIENTGVQYKDWTAFKEVSDVPKLKVFLELSDGNTGDAKEIAEQIYQEIKSIDDGLYVYNEIDSLEELLDFHPIEVILLSHGTFAGFKNKRQSVATDLSSLKPPHINPTSDDRVLLGIS